MKILFTLIAIEVQNDTYLTASKTLAEEIVNYTTHDVMISTNNVDFFAEMGSRVTVRDNIEENTILKYGNEFNYNLKFHAFEEIPSEYDCVIYLDCDIKLREWTQEAEDLVTQTMETHDFCADRLNCILGTSIDELRDTGRTLFSHKIALYDIEERYKREDSIMNSQLPSEHFLILKNDPEKIRRFHEKWRELNYYLQAKNEANSSWGDGFEIGISANYAGYSNSTSISTGIWDGVLGFKFNGNRT